MERQLPPTQAGKEGTHIRSVRKTVITILLGIFLGGGAALLARQHGDPGPKLERRGQRHSDAWLEKQVRHQLLMLPYYSIFDDLEYRVEGDHVELFGEVVNSALKWNAETAIKHIEGVRGVTNRIEVLPPSNFDDRIRLETARAIYGDPPLRRYSLGANPPIHIIVKNGNVRLVGAVGSKMDRQLADAQARSVPGVFSVKDDLRVD